MAETLSHTSECRVTTWSYATRHVGPHRMLYRILIPQGTAIDWVGDYHEEASARLIAAAPELFAALKDMVASYDGIREQVAGDVMRRKLAAADAAIARAEGRA